MIPSLRDWRTGTEITGRARSAELQALDEAIEAYDIFPSDERRAEISRAWSRWKKKHLSVFSSLAKHKRNAAGLFEILDEEFRASGKSAPKGGLSRLALDIPTTLPTGFPNVGSAMASSRIDKAVAEAQAMLRLAVHRIERNDDGLKALHQLWFASTPQADVARRFGELHDYIARQAPCGLREMTFKYDAGDEQLTGIAHVKIKGGNTDTIFIGAAFFDDQKVVASTELVGRPEPRMEHVGATLDAARRYATLQQELYELQMISAAINTSGSETLRGAITARRQRLVAIGGRQAPPLASLEQMLAWCTRRKFVLDGPPLGCSQAVQEAQARLQAEQDRITNAPTSGPHGFKYSAGGVMIHEMTHLLFRTEDERVESFHGEEKRSYGPIRCATLALLDAARAFNNADNYRLFAEGCVAR
jgi:hypothetical protein